MKKKIIYCLLIAAFPVCLILILLGVNLKNSVLVYTGVGILFGGSFLLAVVCVIVMFIRARKKADEVNQRKQHGSELPERETSVPNRYTAAEGALAASIYGFRRLPATKKALGILFLTVTLGSVFAGLILLFFKRFIAAYVCFGCFTAGIFAGIFVAVVGSHIKVPRIKRHQDEGYKTATVLRCDPYSSSYSYASNNNDNVTVRYRIILEIDGKEYETRASQNYEAGTQVTVCFIDGLAIISHKNTMQDKES